MGSADPIGIIDSGFGGLSVLGELRKLLPNEVYMYLADTDNAPYGVKSESEILRLTENNVKDLLGRNCKAIVIACNTATAASVEQLRERYVDIPIIGLEPAIAPAIREHPNENILVIATEATLKTKRFERLLSSLSEHKGKLFCEEAQRIVAFVDGDMSDSIELIEYLKIRFKKYEHLKFGACVLGCTHFPFAKKEIEAALGYRVAFYDGGKGAAKRLQYLLSKNGILNQINGEKSVIWLLDSFAEKAVKMLNKYNL